MRSKNSKYLLILDMLRYLPRKTPGDYSQNSLPLTTQLISNNWVYL